MILLSMCAFECVVCPLVPIQLTSKAPQVNGHTSSSFYLKIREISVFFLLSRASFWSEKEGKSGTSLPQLPLSPALKQAG